MTGALAANVVAFTRTLRAAGLPVGPQKALRALEAVAAVGLERREDVYWALHATLTDRRDQHELFDQAFHLFWRNPDLLKKAMGLLLPAMRADLGKDGTELSRRLQDTLAKPPPPDLDAREQKKQDIRIDGRLVFSAEEILRGKDFEQMTAAELAEAKRIIAGMRLSRLALPTRRFRPAARGPRIDLRRTLRDTARAGGGDVIELARATRRERPPPLVVLCDISGSMGQYARLLLRFLHALTNDRDRVHVFLFGTRLTNVTRSLKRRDIDAAVERVSREVPDWDGGTRIGQCLDTFNRRWGRRVLGQGAVVLLITDGLDRDAGAGLEDQMGRLRRSCRRLIWLNPLLRWDGYEPRAKGAAAMVSFVHEHRPVHNLNSLSALAEALGDSGGPRR